MSTTTLSRADSPPYYFTSQSSNTFTFRVADNMGGGEFIDYNPLDYISQSPPIRGNRTPTIGGGAIVQQFIQTNVDKEITFSVLLTQAEIEDLETAKSNLGEWYLNDYEGNSYRVTWDMSEGLKTGQQVKANDRRWVQFKFWVSAVL